MRLAVDEAKKAPQHGDIPIGAIVVSPDGDVVARGRNTREKDNDPSAHAEIVALRHAGQTLHTPRLDGCTLVATLEPCVMCAGAIAQAGISLLVFGAYDEKAGACGGGPFDLVRDRSLPHRVDEVIGGVAADESTALLQRFFAKMRSGERD